MTVLRVRGEGEHEAREESGEGGGAHGKPRVGGYRECRSPTTDRLGRFCGTEGCGCDNRAPGIGTPREDTLARELLLKLSRESLKRWAIRCQTFIDRFVECVGETPQRRPKLGAHH